MSNLKVFSDCDIHFVINAKTTIDIKITSMISKCVIAFCSFVQIDYSGMLLLGLLTGETMRLNQASELVEQFVKVAHFKPVVKVRMSFNCYHGFKYVDWRRKVKPESKKLSGQIQAQRFRAFAPRLELLNLQFLSSQPVRR